MIKSTSSNYSIWKIRMEGILYYKELHKPILNGIKPDSKIEDAWEPLTQKIVGMIHQFINQHVSASC